MPYRILYRKFRTVWNAREGGGPELTSQPDPMLYLYHSKESIIHPMMSCKVAFPPCDLIAR